MSWSFFNEICLRRVKYSFGAWNTLRVWNALRAWGGEFHFTSTEGRYFTIFARKLFHIRQRRIFHSFLPTSPKLWTDSNRHTVGDDLPGVPNKFVQTGRRGRRPLQFKNYLQSHRCNGVLDRFGPPHRRGRPPGRPEQIHTNGSPRTSTPTIQKLFTKP